LRSRHEKMIFTTRHENLFSDQIRRSGLEKNSDKLDGGIVPRFFGILILQVNVMFVS